VLAQKYPNLEHLVVDGMSTDDTSRILARYPHLRVFALPTAARRRHQQGVPPRHRRHPLFPQFRRHLLPGTLERVAQEMHPAQGKAYRHGSVPLHRRETTSQRVSSTRAVFEGHRRVLEVWKGHAIPQPAVFWSREVWQRCGPLDERERLVLDYDLFCRFSKHYPFHVVDQVFRGYRLHAQSKTCSSAGQEYWRNRSGLPKYWGSVFAPAILAPARLLFRFRLDRRKRAIDLLRQARRRGGSGSGWAPPGGCWLACRLAPDVLAFVVLLPKLARRRSRWLDLARSALPTARRACGGRSAGVTSCVCTPTAGPGSFANAGLR